MKTPYISMSTPTATFKFVQVSGEGKEFDKGNKYTATVTMPIDAFEKTLLPKIESLWADAVKNDSAMPKKLKLRRVEAGKPYHTASIKLDADVCPELDEDSPELDEDGYNLGNDGKVYRENGNITLTASTNVEAFGKPTVVKVFHLTDEDKAMLSEMAEAGEKPSVRPTNITKSFHEDRIIVGSGSQGRLYFKARVTKFTPSKGKKATYSIGFYLTSVLITDLIKGGGEDDIVVELDEDELPF